MNKDLNNSIKSIGFIEYSITFVTSSNVLYILIQKD